jgi:hypothetical protein
MVLKVQLALEIKKILAASVNIEVIVVETLTQQVTYVDQSALVSTLVVTLTLLLEIEVLLDREIRVELMRIQDVDHHKKQHQSHAHVESLVALILDRPLESLVDQIMKGVILAQSHHVDQSLRELQSRLERLDQIRAANRQEVHHVVRLHHLQALADRHDLAAAEVVAAVDLHRQEVAVDHLDLAEADNNQKK